MYLSPCVLPLTTILATIFWYYTSAPLFLLAMAITIALYTMWRYNALSCVLALISVILPVWCYYQLHYGEYYFDKLQTYHSIRHNGYITITDTEPALPHKRTRFITTYVEPDTEIPSYTCKMRIPCNLECQVGDTLYAYNLHIPRITNMSFRQYLIRNGLAGFFHKTPKMHKYKRPTWHITRYLCNIRNALCNYAYTYMHKEAADIIVHIVLGYKAVDTGTRHVFENWGLSHMLARSGLHLVAFSLCCTWLLGPLTVYYVIKDILISVILVLYALLSWPSTSFLRALIMILVFYACRGIGLRYTPLHWLTMTAIIFLCYNPIQAIFLDFQLSFLMTGVLAWFITMFPASIIKA